MSANRRVYRVTRAEWQGEGTFAVEVAAPWPRTATTDRGARRAALRADPMRKAHSTRLGGVTYVPGEGLRYRFTIARFALDRW